MNPQMGGDITVRDEILLSVPRSGKKVIQSSYNTLDKRTLRKSRFWSVCKIVMSFRVHQKQVFTLSLPATIIRGRGAICVEEHLIPSQEP